MKPLFAELFTKSAPTLGEAIQRAKSQVNAASPDVREVLQTFTLIGDPALRWRPVR